jgi:hypothetical protein
MADPLPERDAALLLDMLLAARDAKSFVAGLSEAAFVASRLHQNAVIRSLEIIGEAAGKVSAETCDAHPETIIMGDSIFNSVHADDSRPNRVSIRARLVQWSDPSGRPVQAWRASRSDARSASDAVRYTHHTRVFGLPREGPADLSCLPRTPPLETRSCPLCK